MECAAGAVGIDQREDLSVTCARNYRAARACAERRLDLLTKIERSGARTPHTQQEHKDSNHRFGIWMGRGSTRCAKLEIPKHRLDCAAK